MAYADLCGPHGRALHGIALSGDHDLMNGTLVTEQLARVIARCVHNVHVSLDGPTEEINAKMRGKGVFGGAVRGIRLLKSAGVPKVRVVTSVSSVNVAHMREMRKQAEELGVELGTSIFAEVGRGNLHPNLSPDTDELIRFFREEAVSLMCDSSVSDRTLLNISAGVTCGSGTLMVSVDCFGNVYPCHLFHRPEFKIGNLFQEPDLHEMLRRSAIAVQFRERTVESRKCHGCSVEPFCKGGCLAHTVAVNETAEDPWKERDPYCTVQKEVLGAQLWQIRRS